MHIQWWKDNTIFIHRYTILIMVVVLFFTNKKCCILITFKNVTIVNNFKYYYSTFPKTYNNLLCNNMPLNIVKYVIQIQHFACITIDCKS